MNKLLMLLMLMFAIAVMQVNGGYCMPPWQGGVSIRLNNIAKLIFWNFNFNTIKTVEFEDQGKALQ